ncbi:bifunctional diguanylate cyclase/phosphodiesterase [Sulfurirhabdus autotrophica]|uniref:PAS domain S-box-containing protein/diguanylate cyclase (GGDEF)-like protein n=1 Tax=Sulfurirhabdus autotrophica TaxID=1706046 RepID=A0A4R3YCX0_9PROT|nr:EAL domain-containing protein [Sulfurirhabdus autotrophica]TCV90315.1 PAS domain S-box-containing protein/diguanylate cyclase (GGDEF)-like protein [Sulfurirhabdus autotrophica]
MNPVVDYMLERPVAGLSVRDLKANARLKKFALAFCVLAIFALFITMTIPPITKVAHGQTSMLAVHLLLELFAIIIAIHVVTISWHTFDTKYEHSANILICGFLIVASCDLVHALTYEGMPPFLTESSTPRAIFFWLMGRTFEVVTMWLLAINWTLPLSRKLSLLLGVMISALLIWFGSYSIEAFPVTFINGQGVTSFKAYYEYSLCLLYIVVAILLWQRANRSGETRYYLLAVSSFVMGIGEISFTAYVAPSDFQNIFGHVYKVVAYALLYWATFIINIRAPFETVRKNEMRFRYMLETSPIAVRITDSSSHKVIFANQRYAELINLPREQVVGTDPILFYLNPQDYKNVLQQLEKGFSVTDKMVELKIPGAQAAWALASYFMLEYENKQAVLGWFYDVTNLKDAEAKIQHMAFYDALTQLPNRRLLMDRLNQALATSTRNGQYGAVLFIDLDRFKTINDTKGHEIGDLLLIEVAKRLQYCVREGDTVSRLGGDEFLVVLETLSTDTDEAAIQAEMVAEKIRATLSEPYMLKERSCYTTSSIGIILFTSHQENPDDLLRYADTAMYQAKTSGRNTIRFYDASMQLAIDTRAELEDEMRLALKNQQFCLYYQIQVDNLRHSIGAEVLLRWQHPEHGLISPAQFIPLAEETGLIIPIGKCVLQIACTQLAAWQNDALTRDLTLAVNVSAKQFHEVDFVNQMQQVLLESGANPSLLKLELTESTMLENIEETIAKMREIEMLGVSFSMDDFGTGYSSLQYLKRLPLSQIKIDQSFIRDIVSDANDASIVQTIIAMTETLGLNVIAEGVENEEQCQFLELRGCHAFQGYLFSKPVPLDEFMIFLNNRS